MKSIRKFAAVLLTAVLVFGLAACGTEEEKKEETGNTTGDARTAYSDAHVIVLSETSATFDGEAVEEFDYTWNVDPSTVHDEVKNAPAEYYTGTEPDTDAAVYIDHELYYYPSLSSDAFKLVNYDGEQEWAYYYTDGTNNDYIFATLPKLGTGVPTAMMHTAEEAAQNKVLHITQAGSYILEGEWNGQIWVDLGDEDDTFTDESAKVTLILNGVDITNTVAPGVVFYSVYECDNTWEEKESYSADVDLTNAGANVIIADGSVNTVKGENIYRMLKTKYKDETSTDAVKVQKKMRKIDAAFYSFVSMNVSGGTQASGSLSVTSGFEGMDSELHLNLASGNITITSEDDGINVNEDYVSVVSFNGANVTINASQGAEGDGVDSNGYIVVNSGKIAVNNVTVPDSAMDSEKGIYYNGGEITIDGTAISGYTTGNVYNSINGTGQGMGGGGTGGQPGEIGGGGKINPFDNTDFDIKEFKEKVAELGDDATLQDVLEILGWGGGGQDGTIPTGPDDQGGSTPTMPDGQQGNPPEIPDGQGGQGGNAPAIPDGQNGQGGNAPEIPGSQTGTN